MILRTIYLPHVRLAAMLVSMFVFGRGILPAQTVSTIAGNGVGSYTGDGGPAVLAGLNSPRGIAFDASGNMYIADELNNCVRRVTPGGTISTIAGIGIAGYSGDGGPALAAMLNQPEAVAFDTTGELIIADSQNRRIRMVDKAGIITTIAGTGTEGYSGDGGPATSAMLHRAVALAADTAGNIYFADSVDNRVREISTSGIINTVAGTGVAGYSGDLGPATSATLNIPVGVAVDSAFNLYIADAENHVIRKVTPSNGIIYTVAGDGIGAGTQTGSFAGDGGIATAAGLNTPEDVAVDPAGNLYIADTENYRIRKVLASNNVITTVAGTGIDGFSGDGGPAIEATLNLPWSVKVSANGDLFIGDMMNNRIRAIALSPGPLLVPTATGSSFPSVNAAGTVNSASFAPGSNPLAPGSIATIFGSNLNTGAAIPTSSFGSNGRLVTTLGGASVTFNGIPAPQYSSFQGQLNVEIPQELAGATSASVQVTEGAQTSAPQTVPLGPFSPGIFTINDQGTGQGAIQISNTTLFAAPVGSIQGAQSRPANPGEDISIYCTGLGSVVNAPATGQPASSGFPAVTTTTPQVTIGGIPAAVIFSGLTPNSVGLYQVNVQLPAAAPAGDAIPLVLTISGKQSNQVTLAIQ